MNEHDDYQVVIEQVAAEIALSEARGSLPDYIPELARVDPDRFGLALHAVDGRHYAVGDSGQRFSTQSISKVFGLCLAVSRDAEQVRRRVGVEPSGDPFNSLALLEVEGGVPRNPLVNAGALVICDILLSLYDDPLAHLLAFVRSVAGAEDITVDGEVAASEAAAGHRNRALASLMRSFDNIENDVDAVVDLYVQQCAIALSCSELARGFGFLADRGRSLPRELVQLDPLQIRRINAIMLTCGFYDEAGEFAFLVGLPGKSGVGGGIAAVCPDRFTVAAWSPRLTKGGNSYLGTKALERLTTLTDSSIF